MSRTAATGHSGSSAERILHINIAHFIFPAGPRRVFFCVPPQRTLPSRHSIRRGIQGQGPWSMESPENHSKGSLVVSFFSWQLETVLFFLRKEKEKNGFEKSVLLLKEKPNWGRKNLSLSPPRKNSMGPKTAFSEDRANRGGIEPSHAFKACMLPSDGSAPQLFQTPRPCKYRSLPPHPHPP